MSTTPPVLDFRDPNSLTSALTTITLVGTGINNSIPTGTASSPFTCRMYNNYSNASGVADATNCYLAVYDSTSSQGSQATSPTIQTWIQVKVLDYNGIATNADAYYYPIGGTVKRRVPVNSAVIGGTTSNYVTFSIQVVVPASASGSATTQGLWIESNYNL